MSKFELGYGGYKTITHTVEVLLTDIASDDEIGSTGFINLVDDFSDYLEQSGLEDYWGDYYEIYPFKMCNSVDIFSKDLCNHYPYIIPEQFHHSQKEYPFPISSHSPSVFTVFS